MFFDSGFDSAGGSRAGALNFVSSAASNYFYRLYYRQFGQIVTGVKRLHLLFGRTCFHLSVWHYVPVRSGNPSFGAQQINEKTRRK
ncbi:MAG: hypothetical protein ACLFVE_10610 [Chitinispirillaceae bacterium]